jgi:serine acetyltransferase
VTGDRVFVGIGASIVNNVSICDDVIIGAGGVVIKDIDEKGTYVGVPARKK